MPQELMSQEKIKIFQDLFKGREDVFAMYWEKADKSANGYTPVCLNEWKTNICYKLQRKKCKDCQNAKYASFNENYIESHLRGNKIYGIYPLLDDNTSYFIAADFDEENWDKDVLKFYKKCEKYNLPVYIERSRSGKGCHGWIFFSNNYPANKSRNIIVNILKEAKIIDQFEKEDSFDRLFPNQDFLSGKGFGNLIALPLQGQARKELNTIFLNPENNLSPFDNQWDILKRVKKVKVDFLDNLYGKFNNEKKPVASPKNKISILFKEQIFIGKNHLPKILINFLKDNLNFANSEFLIKKRMGLNVYGVERYFKLIESDDEFIKIPRGFFRELLDFLNKNNIKFSLTDERKKLEEIKFDSSCKLFDYQKDAVDNMLASEQGVLVAPPGAGKTIMGIEMIAKLKQPSLILVHKKQIFNQWIERIEHFLNISKRDIGQIGSNKKKEGGKITVAMIQTLNRMDDIERISDKFGLILVDECHHLPAKMFRDIIIKFSPYYLYGLTATPKRKNNDEKLIFFHLGDILHTIDKNFREEDNNSVKNKKIRVVIRNTEIEVPFKVKTDNAQILLKIIAFDSGRNKKITEDIMRRLKFKFINQSECLWFHRKLHIKNHISLLAILLSLLEIIY